MSQWWNEHVIVKQTGLSHPSNEMLSQCLVSYADQGVWCTALSHVLHSQQHLTVLHGVMLAHAEFLQPHVLITSAASGNVASWDHGAALLLLSDLEGAALHDAEFGQCIMHAMWRAHMACSPGIG